MVGLTECLQMGATNLQVGDMDSCCFLLGENQKWILKVLKG